MLRRLKSEAKLILEVFEKFYLVFLQPFNSFLWRKMRILHVYYRKLRITGKSYQFTHSHTLNNSSNQSPNNSFTNSLLHNIHFIQQITGSGIFIDNK